MTAIEEVRSWSLSRWREAIDELEQMGITVDIVAEGGGYRVNVRKGPSVRSGWGLTMTEALADFAVQWLESQAEVLV